MGKKSPIIPFILIVVMLLMSLMVLMQAVSAEDELATPLDLKRSPTKEAAIHRCPIRGQIAFYEEPDTSSRRLLAYVGQLDVYVIGQNETGDWLRVAYYNRQELVRAWAQARFVELCLSAGETLAVIDVNNPSDGEAPDYADDSDVNANIEPQPTQISASPTTRVAVTTSPPTQVSTTIGQPTATGTKIASTATVIITDTPTSFQPPMTRTPTQVITDTPTSFQPPFTQTQMPTDTPTSFQPSFTPTVTDTPTSFAPPMTNTQGPSDTPVIPTDTPTSFQPPFTPTAPPLN